MQRLWWLIEDASWAVRDRVGGGIADSWCAAPTWARRAVAVVVSLALAAGAAGGGAWWWAEKSFEEIPTFTDVYAAQGSTAWTAPTTTMPVPPSTTPEPAPGQPVAVAPATIEWAGAGAGAVDQDALDVYLIFSTGTQGLSAADAAAAGIPAERADDADGLTDTILVAVVDDTSRAVRVLSIPRDTWIAEHRSRINAVLNRSGPDAFAGQVATLTGLDVDHMVAVNFAAFARLTDAVGGVELWMEGPARDRDSGLEITGTGCHAFDGIRALQLVRSRKYEVQRDGRWRFDASASDFGRIERQQRFLFAVLDKLATPSTIPKVPALVDIAKDNLIVDEDLNLSGLVGLARSYVSGFAIEFSTLPATPGHVGAASVLFVDEDAATAVRARLADGTTPAKLSEHSGTITADTTPAAPSATTTPSGAVPTAPSPATCA